MGRCIEGGSVHCPFKSTKNGRLVPVAVDGSGGKAVCVKAYDNGKDHPKEVSPNTPLIKFDICNRTLRNGDCKRWGEKAPPSGLRVR